MGFRPHWHNDNLFPPILYGDSLAQQAKRLTHVLQWQQQWGIAHLGNEFGIFLPDFVFGKPFAVSWTR